MVYTYANLELPVRDRPAAQRRSMVGVARTALEDPAFPFEVLSETAELESWRKEVNRPIYHLHKWWAQRLGSVFRAILIGAVESDPDRILDAFYSPVRYEDLVVFDPFMGSGTTIGEALKLGMRGIGRDINHVAYFAVRNALQSHPRAEVVATFEAIERDVAPEIRRYYRTRLADGSWTDVLYYFWVKVVPCPACASGVDLFSSYVFSRNAYPKKHPEAQVLCPRCGEINETRFDSTEVRCHGCNQAFDPQLGPARGQKATCPSCATVFPIAATVRRGGRPPTHRLYAKLVLAPDGTKSYQRATAEDDATYREAELRLAALDDAFPDVAIRPGHNTDQVLAYGYRAWHEMFNARQLLALDLLRRRIAAIPERRMRELFACLFSGTLEFNNMFASFKGEGTGAVRHMFAHHILKPERTPLEANVWGTPKSSGAFSTLFRSRLLRALDYRDQPFEIKPTSSNGKVTGTKVYGLSPGLARPVVDGYEEFRSSDDAVYLSCGDSATTDIPSSSVDLVITDPPFFDNVHYSELADFFHVWQRHLLGTALGRAPDSTRRDGEVQSRDAEVFAARLRDVFAECCRVLRPNGLMAFTYHHSRPEGWHAIVTALAEAGFVVSAALPIKAEMSGGTPKSQASSPIDVDVILVCRPADAYAVAASDVGRATAEALAVAADQVKRFTGRRRVLSSNDVRVIVMAQMTRLQSQQVAAGGPQLAEGIVEAVADEAVGRLYDRHVAGLTHPTAGGNGW